MRGLPLRAWIAAALVVVILSPFVAWVGTIIALKGPTKTRQAPWERESDHAVHEATVLIRTHPGEWLSPAFQQDLSGWLSQAGWSATLIDTRGAVVFHYGPGSTLSPEDQLHTYGSETQIGLVQGPGDTMSGTYFLVRSADPTIPWMLLTAVSGLSLASALAVWAAGRAINRPIAELSRAAHMVNSGELEFAVPASRVKELNELSAAFGAMRDGLRVSLIEQAAMEQERRMFIAAIAHDLRTPLSSVRGYLEGLRDGVARTPEKVEHYIAVALDKTGSLERLIDGLFAYAKTEYLSQPPQREQLDLGALLLGSVEAVRPRAEASGVSVVCADGPQACRVDGDRLMLSRIIDNLLDNAVRYTPRGGTVVVGWTGGPEGCQFWVHDSGPGIPEGDQGRVFEPLYRGDKARGSRTGGAGLGLAIARRLARAHGGDIAVVNDGGARFTVKLPASPGQEG